MSISMLILISFISLTISEIFFIICDINSNKVAYAIAHGTYNNTFLVTELSVESKSGEHQQSLINARNISK